MNCRIIICILFAFFLNIYVASFVLAGCTDEERAKMIMEDDLSTEEIDKKCGSRTTFDEEKKPAKKVVIEQKTGTVNIKSPMEKSELEIYINGSMHSYTDFFGEKSLELKPGSYSIQLKGKGKKSEIKQITVSTGDVLTVTFSDIEDPAPKPKPAPPKPKSTKKLPKTKAGRFVHSSFPKFSIKYPSKWTTKKRDCGQNSVFGIVSPSQYKIPAVCVYVYQSIVNTDNYIKGVQSGWRKNGYELRLSKRNEITLKKGGIPATALVFTASGPADLRIVYVLASRDNKTVAIMIYTHPSVAPQLLRIVPGSLKFYGDEYSN